MSYTEQGDIALETQQDLNSSDEDTHDTQAAGGHRRAKARARVSHIGKGNVYQTRRLTKGARNPLFCSVLRRSRN